MTLGYTEKLELELPADVLSVTVIAEGQSIRYTIEHFEGPNGEILEAENPPGVHYTRMIVASRLFRDLSRVQIGPHRRAVP